MINFFEQHPRYLEKFQEEANAPRPNIKHVRNLRQDYKVIVGWILGAFVVKNGAAEISADENITRWCLIADQSVLFHDAAHMLECIMDEMAPREDIKADVDFKTKRRDSKSDLQYIIRLSQKEARRIQGLYNRVARYDPDVNGHREYLKIRKALLFIKTAIGVCLYSKLPTVLSADEYDRLVMLSCRPDVAALRYRFNESTGEYRRIGGQPRKSAYKLCGIAGCTVLIERAVHRYEVMLKALGR